MTALQDAINQTASASRIIIFTGAGASSDSGIGTFRGSSSSGGYWSGMFGSLALLWGGTPVGWQYTPRLVWGRFVKDFYQPIVEANPHAGHHALASLEQDFQQKFRDVTTITMNVDGLHQRAGSKKVLELHGSVRKFICASCGERASLPMTLDPSQQPRCDKCSRGRIRPEVTLFTEDLPEETFRKAHRAVKNLCRKDVMLIIGTSSVVYPAASLPEIAKMNRGATLIEFNLDIPTQLTPMVDISVPGKAVDSLPAFVNGLLHELQLRDQGK